MNASIDSRPSGRRKIYFHLILYLAFFVFLLLLEGVFRLVTPYVPPIKYFVTGKTHGDDPTGAATFEGDAWLGWRFKAGLRDHWWDFTLFATNSDHIRHPREIVDKLPGSVRIVCLGDSVTFGYRVPLSLKENPLDYNKESFPYPRILENLLRRRFPDREIEVITLATPGYSSHQGLAWLRRDIDKYKPDLVITSFGWNDTDFRQLADKITLPVQWHRVWLRRLVSCSQIGIHLSTWASSKKAHAKTSKLEDWPSRVSTEDYIANIGAIASVSQEYGAQIIVIGQVYRDRVVNPRQAEIIGRNRRMLAKMCKAKQIPFLLIEQLTEKGYPENENLFGELIHPNVEGHRIMADRLIEMIEEIRL